MPPIDDLPPPPKSGIDDLPPPPDELKGGGPGAGQAALEHFGNSASMGYLPHLQAAVAQLLPDPSGHVDEALAAQGFKIQQPDHDYVHERDANIARLKQEGEEHPYASGAGTVAGAIAGGAAMSPLMPARAATMGARLAQAAKVGATMGAVANPGDTEGEVNPAQIGQRALNAGVGAAVGPVAELAAEGIGKAGQYLGDKLSDFAEQKAFKASGAYKKDMAKAMSKDKVNEIGRDLLDEGVVTPFSTPSKVASRLGGKIEEQEGQLGGLLENADQKLQDPKFLNSLSPEQWEQIKASNFDPKAIGQKLKDDLLEKYSAVPRQKIQPALDEIDSWMEQLAQGKRGPGALQNAKVQMNRFLNDSDFYREPGIQKEGTLAVRRALKEGVENKADALANVMGDEGGAVKATNRKLGNLLQARDMAENRAAGEAANRAYGLTDAIHSAAGAEVGTTIGGMAAGPFGAKAGAAVGALAGGAANKFARTFGNGMMATGSDALSGLLEKAPALASVVQKYPQAAPMLLQMLRGQDNQPAAPDLEQQPIAPAMIDKFKNNPGLVEKLSDPNLKEQIKKAMDRAPTSQQFVPHEEAKQKFLENN